MVYTMFKGMFYKFAQNDFLVNKLLSTENLNLYEATTDMFYGAGIGLNSKKWEMGNWEGKNMAGKLLCKVRYVLKNKLEEGLTLNRLVFNYSLPSLHDDGSNQLRELFLGQVQPKPRGSQYLVDKSARNEGGRSSLMSIGEEAATVLPRDHRLETEEEKELSQKLEELGKGDDTDSSLFTLCDRAVRRESHSLENKMGGLKQRNNQARRPDSLTRRERVFIKKTPRKSTVKTC